MPARKRASPVRKSPRKSSFYMEKLGETLFRIDERVLSVKNSLAELKDKVDILEAELRNSYTRKEDVEHLKTTMSAFELRNSYSRKEDLEQIKNSTALLVTQEEFKPIKKIVYGFAGIGLTTIAISLITLVVKTYST